MIRSLLISLLVLSGCGYRFDGGETIAVSVPYVVGDYQGELTDALVAELSKNSSFRSANGSGDWILRAKVVDTQNDRIGYRYEFERKEIAKDVFVEKLKDDVIGIENRKSITVEVCIEDAYTGKVILGPQRIKADADYDYTDPNVLNDLAFTDPSTGELETSIQFSLGQLDSVGSAGENAIYPIYERLARKIVDGMIASGNWYDE
jgi:hypothetical protein